MLWFAAPPMHIARPPPAKHSLKYLAYLAGKRKEMEAGMDVDDDGKGGDDDREDKGQREREWVGVPTVSEMMRSAMEVVDGV